MRAFLWQVDCHRAENAGLRSRLFRVLPAAGNRPVTLPVTGPSVTGSGGKGEPTLTRRDMADSARRSIKVSFIELQRVAVFLDSAHSPVAKARRILGTDIDLDAHPGT